MKRYKLVKYNDNVENFGTLQEDESGDLVMLEDVPQWISVKDRLPEHTNDVLVFFRDDDGSWHIDNVCHDGFGWTFYGEQVTHWMPLPEPPTLGES